MIGLDGRSCEVSWCFLRFLLDMFRLLELPEWQMDDRRLNTYLVLLKQIEYAIDEEKKGNFFSSENE